MQKRLCGRTRDEDDADGCRATGVVSTRETSEGLTDVIVIFIVDVDNKKKVSTFVIDCAKPVRIVVDAEMK